MFSQVIHRLATLRLGSVSLYASALVPAALYTWGGYARRWAGDDGMINLRVVQQLMEGNGFVYNAGERTEAVTSVAWLMVLWLWGELGLDLEQAAWIGSLAFGFVGVGLAALASARLTAGEHASRSLVLPFGLVAYAAVPAVWDYATSALENGLGIGFLGASYYLLARAVTTDARRWHLGIGAFVGLAPLLRPDYAVYGAPLILVLLLQTAGWRGRGQVALCAALPGAIYQLFRMGYFACLVPNTAIAKEAFDARWDQGLIYLKNTFATYWLVVPLLCCVLSLVALWVELAQKKQLPRAAVSGALALGGLLHLTYVTRLGGDFMHGRMVLPGLFAILAAAGTQRVPLELSGAQVRAGLEVALVALWGVYCAAELRVPIFDQYILDERRWYSESAGEPHPVRVADYARHQFLTGPLAVRARIATGCARGDAALQNGARDTDCRRVAFHDATDGALPDHPEGEAMALETSSVAPTVVAVLGFRPLGIGGVGVGTRISLTDSFGLADSVASRMELRERGRPGHEKFFTTPWFAAKYTAEGVTVDERVIKAKRVLQCGLLRELFLATHEPMSVSRFMKNVSLSFSLHRMRVPADPYEAERRFCQS